MLDKDQTDEAEERIRRQVGNLTDEKRLEFYKRAERSLKDPDTYAVLNYLFIAGLHHFYLGKWQHGLAYVAIFWAGVIMLFTDYWIPGILAVAGVSIFELYELFRSQIIVQDHNNRIMEQIYREVTRT